MPEQENFTSEEIVNEWYGEQGLSPEGVVEKEAQAEERERQIEKEAQKAKDKEEQIKKEIELSSLAAHTEEVKEQEAQKKLEVKGKIKELLDIAAEKGLEHAIKQAQQMNDPFLLDLFHDVLAKEAMYKNYLRK